MTIKDQVRQLVCEELQREGRRLPVGVDEEEIVAFEGRSGLQVPPELRELFYWSNGPPVGPTGIYRLDPHRRQGIEREYRDHPGWGDRGWIPMAGDGCGNTYLLDTRWVVGAHPEQLTQPQMEALPAGSHPVYFKDHEADPDDLPEYVVASGLWTFLWFWLLAQRWEVDWPFNREQVLKEDPALEQYQGPVPLPWLSE